MNVLYEIKSREKASELTIDAAFGHRLARRPEIIGALQELHLRRANQARSAEPRYLWLRDDSLEDSANLPDPDVIAAEIVQDLEAALQQFAAIANDLKK